MLVSFPYHKFCDFFGNGIILGEKLKIVIREIEMSQTLFQILYKLYSIFFQLNLNLWHSIDFKFERNLPFSLFLFLSSDSLEKSKIPILLLLTLICTILMFMYKLDVITDHSDLTSFLSSLNFKFKKFKIQIFWLLLLFWNRRKLRVFSSQ